MMALVQRAMPSSMRSLPPTSAARASNTHPHLLVVANILLPCFCHAAVHHALLGGRGFFTKLGFQWLDAPLCEEGLKQVERPAHCTCGQCTRGVLSKRMRRKLQEIADA